MTDKEIFEELSTIIRRDGITENNSTRFFELLKVIDDVNFRLHGDNLLYLLSKNGGSSKNDLELIKLGIDLVLERGIDLSAKFGRYNAPILYFVSNPEIFEHLCIKGFDPNERISGVYENYPYFAIHHDFIGELYIIAKKYGFNPFLKLANNRTMLQLVFNTFHDIEPKQLGELISDFSNEINSTDEFGRSLLHIICGRREFINYWDIEMLEYLIRVGVEKNIRTTSEFYLDDTLISPGITAYELYLKNPFSNKIAFGKKIEELIK